MAFPVVEITPERFQKGLTGWLYDMSLASLTRRGVQAFIPSEVPARSQAWPGLITPQPRIAAKKSGPPEITRKSALNPNRAATPGINRPNTSPGRMNGGNFSLSKSRLSRIESFQNHRSNPSEGKTVLASPVRAYARSSGQPKKNFVFSYNSGSFILMSSAFGR